MRTAKSGENESNYLPNKRRCASNEAQHYNIRKGISLDAH